MFLSGNKNRKDTAKQIVVLGAGFGGVRATLRLSKYLPEGRIILVSHNDYQIYHPTLYEVATAMRSDGDAFLLKGTLAFPIRDILVKCTNVTFKQAWVLRIDVDRKIVQTDDGDLMYDFLVIALGSETDFFNIPGLAVHSLPLKTFEQAIAIRNRIAEALDQYKKTNDESYLHFVIGGGGFTGVEFSAELSNYLRHLGRREKISKQPVLWLLEGANQLLPGFPAPLASRVKRRLEKLGIKVRLQSFITAADETGVSVGGQKILARTVIWTGGVKAVSAPFTKNISCDKKGRTVVGSRFNLDSYSEVFILGDCASFIDPAKAAPLPPTAQAALSQASFVARTIYKLTRGEPPSFYQPPKSQKYLVPLGGKYAIFTSNGMLKEGFWPYCLRRLADLRYFLSILPPNKAFSFWLKGSMVYTRND